MKHSSQPFKKTGLCHICGKSTKLMIHAACGKKVDAAKKANKVFDRINQQQHENGQHNAKKKAYENGVVPPFCYDQQVYNALAQGPGGSSPGPAGATSQASGERRENEHRI